MGANLKIKKEFQTSLLEGWARHTAPLKRHIHLKPFWKTFSEIIYTIGIPLIFCINAPHALPQNDCT